jgi:hypothetical protein
MNHLKRMIVAILLCASVHGQNCQALSPPNATACTQLFTYDGSNNLLYACKARSIQPYNSRLSISAASNANPVVFTSTGHGFSTLQLPLVTISGGTGNWTAVNGTFTATVIDANTFSIAVNSTSFGALAGTVVFDTTAPRTTQSIWSVVKFTYTGTNMTGAFYIGGSPAERNTCSGAPAQYQ